MSDEKNLEKLKEAIQPLEKYDTLKKLSLDVAIYIGKKQRERFFSLLSKFTDKYELLYKNQPEPIKPPQEPVRYTKVSVTKADMLPQADDDDAIRCCICYIDR